MQRTFRGISAALVGLGLAVLVGCTPTAAPSPIPTPSVPTCVPLDGASPFPCTQADFDALAEQRALYEEAEAVLRRYQAEVDRQEADWSLREMTPELLDTTTGAFRQATQQLIDQDRHDQARRIGDAVPIAWVKWTPAEARGGSVATIQYCVDGTRERYVTKDSPDGSAGVAVMRKYFFTRTDGQLKIATSDAERVPSC
ncbi:hypothetical protein ET989_05525 [Propioniciclava sinopodophylli]|uniref:Lipoprotein n=1 Tax=Propioniciclava sinopodophylli TaxID=1837344 RepID=A0A4Q9KFI6_9ACTN|nr:hypothetical protein [Propioniciclava sinopodophylli]TBT85913.1 hypothetical protein ET989_05525 [Propioniciclava sinopodophylli]